MKQNPAEYNESLIGENCAVTGEIDSFAAQNEWYMNTVEQQLSSATCRGLQSLFGLSENEDHVIVNETRKEFEGDYTVVLFPFLKKVGKSPQDLAEMLGPYLVEAVEGLTSWNVVKGFLNLSFEKSTWIDQLYEKGNSWSTDLPANGKKILIEFCSPNTNKPLHLGHVRNILLGWSTSCIYEFLGYDVFRTQIVNDRGIAICKSMLAWEKFSNGETPESTGLKGDHFVGDYYVRFEKAFQKEYGTWQAEDTGLSIYESLKKDEEDKATFFKRYRNMYFNEHSTLGGEARGLLIKWESGDEEARLLWSKMNQWVYSGFGRTFKKLKVEFDKLYYESDTWKLGKEVIEKGLNNGLFYKKDDGSVWVDLEDCGLDHKILLRSDGTSVYITQDLGTANLRYEETAAEKMVYVVGDEQDYHFQVLFETLGKVGVPYKDGLFHLSYGMVDLPTGKMKGREGTIVDADDLIEKVKHEARFNTAERGEIASLPIEKQDQIISIIGMAALKFFIIKVNAKKRMVFDPKESVDLQGQTGPYIQYAYVRINGVVGKARDQNLNLQDGRKYLEIQEAEIEIIRALGNFKTVVASAAREFDPSLIANYCYALAKRFNRFWHDLSILGNDEMATNAFRVSLCMETGAVLKVGMKLLGIEMPEKM